MSDDPKRSASTTQHYHQRLRDVQNADQIINIQNELGRLEGGAGDLPDKAVLAPALVDRGPQYQPLRERLDAMLPAGGALLVVVPGCRDDLHQALVVRCGLVAFVEDYGGPGAWRYLKRLAWPEGAGSVEAVLRTVRDALSLDKTYRQADIERAVATLGRHLCFSHFVDGPTWEDDDGALVRNWTDYFANRTLQVGHGSLVVGFLCLVLGEDRTPACKKIEAFVDALRAREHGTVLVTRPLALIRETHVADWTAEVSRYLEDDALEADLLDLPGGLFREVQVRRLGEIWRSVRDALAEAVKRRPARFAEGGK